MRETAAERGREADSVSSELAAMNVYREDKEITGEYEDSLEPRNSDVAEEDIGVGASTHDDDDDDDDGDDDDRPQLIRPTYLLPNHLACLLSL